MIHGLFLDPRTWKIDYLPSSFWNPQKYGVNIELYQHDAFQIPARGIDKKYKFVLTTEVWELPIQRVLEYLRNEGFKIILVPREITPTKAYLAAMFNFEKFRYKSKFQDQCYFTPDMVLGTNSQYIELWEGRASNRKTIGYPRFEYYLDSSEWKTRNEIADKHGIEKDKKIIFFPSYPPYGVQMKDGKHINVELQDDLQNTLKALEEYALSHANVQVITKIHPMSYKCYRKKTGRGDEVSGLLRQYHEHPTKYMKVIGDSREDSSWAREMIILADIVVGYTSMMMLEAIILKKPVLHFNFEQCRQLQDTLVFSDDLTTIENPNDMGKYLENPQQLVAKNNKLIDKYLHKVDGKFCERLCAEIKTLVKE